MIDIAPKILARSDWLLQFAYLVVIYPTKN